MSTRPLKRSRTEPTASAPTSDNFLGHFDKYKPLLIIVSPLRKRQCSILERNLSAAGAHVLQLSSLPQSAERSQMDVHAITDSKSRATSALNGITFGSVRYISVKWASQMLASQTLLSYKSYLLQEEPLKPANSQETSSSQGSTSRQKRLLPVWCTQTEYNRADISIKRDLLTYLPHYLCERSTPTQSIYASPNKELCHLLEQLAKKRVLEQAGGSNASADIRARAYRLASAALKCVPFKLQTQQDAQTLYTFGPRVLSVVNEYLLTGSVQEVTQLESDPRLKTLSTFQDMYGVGATTAREFYDRRNIKSVSQLRQQVQQQPESFSEPLRLYLDHYDNLHRTTLQNARALRTRIQTICNTDPSLHVRFTLCGGFRRGEPSGHDVDLLYCRRHPHATDHTSILHSIITRLQSHNILTTILSIHANNPGHLEKRYHKEPSHSIYAYSHDILHALATFNAQTFRLDIVGIRDALEYPFATLAWSGSTSFQRDIRLHCEKTHNWIFNQHGLFNRATGKRVTLQPHPTSEIDIFTSLNLIYRPPFERSC